MQTIVSQEENMRFYYTEEGKTLPIDTFSLENFNNYRVNNEYLWLGNNGLPFYPLVFNIDNQSKYRYSFLMKGDTALHQREYNVAEPFTSLKYVQGARQEQFFELLHTQNFSPRGNFSLGYTKINSAGSYNRQKVNNDNISANIWWTSKKERYNFSFFANRIHNSSQMNGGLKDDTLFMLDTSIFSNRKTLQVQLDNAYRIEVHHQLLLKQRFKIQSSLDSLGNGIEQFVRITTRFRTAKTKYYDTLLNQDFYPNIYNDSSVTKDSTHYQSIQQKLSYTFSKTKGKNKLLFTPFARYDYVDFHNTQNYTYSGYFSTGTNVEIASSKYQLSYHSTFFLNGIRKNNFEENLRATFFLTPENTIYFSSVHSVISPSIDLQQYNGNHNQWQNNFTPIRTLHVEAGSKKNIWGVHLKLAYTDIYKPIYFDYKQTPIQHNGYSQIIQTQVSKTFKLKRWRILSKAVYQYTGGKDIFQLPDFLATLKIAYTAELFNKALSYYTGIKVTYYNTTPLKGFAPSINAFYLTPGMTTGSYPFVSFFFNARIKSVRLFFSVMHLNSGLSKENTYFGALHHPLEDRAYKIGINWNFRK